VCPRLSVSVGGGGALSAMRAGVIYNNSNAITGARYFTRVQSSPERGRPKKTRKEVVREDCQARKLNKEDAMDRCKWRKVIKEAR